MKNTNIFLSKALRKKALISCLIAACFTGIASFGWLFSADEVVSDAFYQHQKAVDGQVVIIGMDQRALDTLGPMPWPRGITAQVIRQLNQNDDSKPAVIGIDVLYVGEGNAAADDQDLVDAAADGGNVVTAAAATFGSQLVDDETSFQIDDRSVVALDMPFESLKLVTKTGHINAMADADGIIRHALLAIDDTNGGSIYSFSRTIYEEYCRFYGENPNDNPDTADGFFYIPFSTKGGGYYDNISVSDILDGSIDPSYFAGKIVLIGPYAAGMQDEYRTSIDHASPMYGIEIQANLIDAFRQGSFAKEVDNFLQLAALFLITVAVLIYFSDRRVKPSLAVWGLVIAGWMLLCKICYLSGLILHVLWIPLSVTVCFIGSIAINYIRSQRERRRITSTFGRYVDPAIMNQLLAQGSSSMQLGGRTLDIAVLFVDIRGFTTMSESLEPTVVVDIINQYLTLTTECIMRYHGTLDKFVGDCTMAFWNAPVPQDDPVYMAARCAMDMVEGSKALGEKLQQRFGRTVSFGIGINYGPAVVGNIGAPKRMDYTAIGDTVNTAARLEANAPGGTIYISRSVADELGNRAVVTSLGGAVPLKGKAAGFEVLTLDSLEDITSTPS